MISCVTLNVHVSRKQRKRNKTDNIVSMEYHHHDLLTRAECTALRGLAIMGIFLHNFCHWLNPVVKENEYQFFAHNVNWLQQVTTGMNELYPAHLLSFFGHYGVSIFLFLSAFGLEKKYGLAPSQTDNVTPSIGFYRFTRYHFLKLFKMMIAGFVAFIIVDAITAGSWRYTFMQIVGQLGMFNNLFSEPDRNIWPGPFWFFGLMFQLYIVYRLFIYRRHWGWTVGLMVVCTAAQLLMDPEGEILNRYRYNFMGGMLPFGFGILYARYAQMLSSRTVICLFVVSILSILMGSTTMVGWTLVPLFVCIAAVTLVKLITYFHAYWLQSGLVWVGGVSAALFVCHPITRKIFIPLSRQGDYYAGLLLYVVTSLALAWFFRELMKRIPSL